MGRSAYLCRRCQTPIGCLTPLFGSSPLVSDTHRVSDTAVRLCPKERIAPPVAHSQAHEMGRKLRETEAGIYHVAARAQVGELLFRDEHDYLRFETEVERIVSPECVCIAACAIDTHY